MIFLTKFFNWDKMKILKSQLKKLVEEVVNEGFYGYKLDADKIRNLLKFCGNGYANNSKINKLFTYLEENIDSDNFEVEIIIKDKKKNKTFDIT